MTSAVRTKFRVVIAVVAATLLSTAGLNAASAEPGYFEGWPTPQISGTPAVGKTLTASFDSAQFIPAPGWTTLTWMVGDTEVGTGPSYKIKAADLDKTIVVLLTAGGDELADLQVSSAATSAVVLGTQSFTPKISGAAAVGSKLKVTGLPSGATLTYKWLRDGKRISGAAKSTYTLTSKDLGKKISVKVTSKKAGYKSLTKTSAATPTVKRAFSKKYAPTISGTAKVGKKLTATTRAWSPRASFKYQWYRDGVKISGATKSTYTLKGADAGKKITVKATGSRSGYYTTPKTSKATAVIAKGSITGVKTPVIKGTTRAGKTLTATAYAVSPSSAKPTFQWYRDGMKISGATSARYALVNADAGSKITVKVTYKLTGYASKSATSKATAKIATRTPAMATDGRYSPDATSELPYIAPGVYFTDTATNSCEWYRDADFDADNGVVVWRGGNARWMVEIKATDKVFDTEGCGSWIRYDGTGKQATTITKDGVYAQGVDIKDGLYEQSGPMSSCLITGDANASHELGSTIDYAYPTAGEGFVLTTSWMVFFTTWGCGTWTWVSGDPYP